MKVIQKEAGNAREILGKQAITENKKVRFLTYVAAASCEDGMLLHNILTKEMILLENTPEEKLENGISESALINEDNLNNSPILREPYIYNDIYQYLVENWYLVPEDNNDKELCLNLRAIAQHLNKINSPKGFLHYTILTTTDCNARCFYCYEAGTRRQNMTDETAHKVVDFICKNYEQIKRFYEERIKKAEENSQKEEQDYNPQITIRWFGGEPLFNMNVIDIITEGLNEKDIPYTSYMISNGYLFDDEVVQKAVDKWNLRNIQITLDGTEEVYNHSKAYIYKEGNPFIRVTDNIEKLLNAGIAVSIRLNLNERNYEDLNYLSDWLIKRFSGYKKLRIYANYLFKINDAKPDEPFNGNEEILCEQRTKLQNKLRNAGLFPKDGIKKSVRTNACMADNDKAVVIQTDGSLGRCEHYYDSMAFGNIDTGITDQKMYDYWKEPDSDAPACDHCPDYPECMRLRGCQSAYIAACQRLPWLQAETVHSLKQGILNCYYNSKREPEIQERQIYRYEKSICKACDRSHSI